MRFIAACTLLLLITSFRPLTIEALAQGSDADAGDLRPGQYIWHPELAPSGEMTVLIDLSRQRAYVRRDGSCIGVSTISTGKPGYETPTGDYTVMEMQRVHHSNRYDNAPMPYMQRLTSYGMAMHGGHLPGYPASHGCIACRSPFARALFKESNIGMQVSIADQAPGGEYGTSSDPSDTRAGLQSCEPDDSQ